MEDLSQVKGFFKKHRERAALIGVLVGMLMLVGLGLYLQKSHNKEEIQSVQPPAVVRLETPQPTGEAGEDAAAGSTSTSYFLQPGPTELLQQLQQLSGLNQDAAQNRYMGLRVLWPGYFFSFKEGDIQEQGGALLLDVSADGFGIELVVDLSSSPPVDLTTLVPGQKVWVAGEISVVDMSGTGRVYLKAEQVRLNDVETSLSGSGRKEPAEKAGQ